MIKWLRKWMGMCDHNYEVVYQDNSISVERCKDCGHQCRFGD